MARSSSALPLGPFAATLAAAMLAAASSGCAARGQAWVHESPHGVVSEASSESETSLAACRAPELPPEEEEVPFERPKSISLGMSYVEDGAGRLVIPSSDGPSMFERDQSRSYGYPAYGGYGYGYVGHGRYLPYPGSSGQRPDYRPPARDTRVPDYGPPMMDKTLPAPVWR